MYVPEGQGPAKAQALKFRPVLESHPGLLRSSDSLYKIAFKMQVVGFCDFFHDCQIWYLITLAPLYSP